MCSKGKYVWQHDIWAGNNTDESQLLIITEHIIHLFLLVKSPAYKKKMWLILKSILGSRNHYHSYFTDGEAEAWESKIRYRLDKGPLVGLPRWPAVKKMPANARTTRDAGLIPGSGGFPGGGYGNLPQYFIPGKFPGQRSLAGYSSWGRKESGMIAHTHPTCRQQSEDLNQASWYPHITLSTTLLLFSH